MDRISFKGEKCEQCDNVFENCTCDLILLLIYLNLLRNGLKQFINVEKIRFA